MRRNVISVIDGAAGSCGKAKVIGEIATDPEIKITASITNSMPNAGHTFVDSKGNTTVFHNIPTAIVNKDTELFIGPGSIIDMDMLKKEYQGAEKYLNGRKIYVHELVPLVEERHKKEERKTLKSGSTFKGGGVASAEKCQRKRNLEFFKGYKNMIVCRNDEFYDRLYEQLDRTDGYVLLEGAQGCDLDLNHSGNYPNTTSRDVSTMRLLSDSAIPPERHLETIMVIRPFPIRISNITETGEYINSGNYGTSRELTWSEINLGAKYECYPTMENIEEYLGDVTLTEEEKEYFLNGLSKDAKLQLFGPRKIPNNLTKLEQLELERLYYKEQGIRKYNSKIAGEVIEDLSELTTVTKKERRIFELDIKKLKNNVRFNKPYCLYLNFFQHLSSRYQGVTAQRQDIKFNRYIEEYLNWLETETNTPIATLGTGPRNNQKIKRQDMIKR